MTMVQNCEAERFRAGMLAWYRTHRRDLPWRQSRDPYAIWVSEIMLQQTRVAVVIERFNAFMMRFPELAALAKAAEADVLALWSGLGYYRRARMMHTAARLAMEEHGGKLPVTSVELRALPGIGSYTAAAIASMAHGEPVAVIDGNVERVLCRFAGWDGDGGKQTALRRKVETLAAKLVDPCAPGDFNQAMMELGATVCLPRNPRCHECPLTAGCITRGEHKTRSRAPMTRRQAAYALVLRQSAGRRHGQEVLLEQRPASLSVMPGMWELPALSEAAVPDAEVCLTVRHAIMQVNYEVRVHDVAPKDATRLTVRNGDRRWVALDEAATMALTGLARKVLRRMRLLPVAARVTVGLKARALAD